MTELQEEVEELRKLTWALTKKISELAARLNAQPDIAHQWLLEADYPPDENDKGSD